MEKNKNSKIIIGIGILLIAVAMIITIVIMNMPEKEYKDVYLDSMEVSKSLENISPTYVDNESTAVDENGRKINISGDISLEKFILENKIGMYDFDLVSDFEDTKLTFTIKNHTKEKVKGFTYRLQLLNVDGSIAGTIDLESKDIPALSKYKVTVNIDSDVADVYNIVPVTDFDTYGYIGGENYEG